MTRDTHPENSLASARERMINVHIAGRGVRTPHILNAMREIPREEFVEPAFMAQAYADSPLPIGEGQTISQPLMVALMIEEAEVKPGDRVLDVGSGSGYGTAVLSRIAERVYGIELHATLAQAAMTRVERLGYDNIEMRVGDGTMGWPEAAPFDAILVAAAGTHVPQALKEQLAIGGCLVMPVIRNAPYQTLTKVRRTGNEDFQEEDVGAVMFVPLIEGREP
jgi:protein-L-isoaspartate(D-aspartate) O-methyltransferase